MFEIADQNRKLNNGRPQETRTSNASGYHYYDLTGVCELPTDGVGLFSLLDVVAAQVTAEYT